MGSAAQDALNNLRKNIEDTVKKAAEATKKTRETNEEITKMQRMLSNTWGEMDEKISKLSKKIGISKDAIADVVTAFVKLKVVPDYFSAIDKYQTIVTKGAKAYSAAINDGYDSAVQFFNANKKEYREAVSNDKKLIAGLEKRVAAGEKLTKKEEKRLETLRKERDTLVPLLDRYRQERREIDSSVKAKEADARASQKKAAEAKKAAEKGKSATKEEIRINKELSQSLKTVLEDVSKIRSALNSGGGLKIQINNAGFTRVLNEMVEAIDRFHERSETGKPRKRNFFDQVLGTKEENQKAADDISKEAKSTISSIKNQFLDPLDETLTSKISKAISKGIKDGVLTGMTELNNINPANMELVQLAKDAGLSQTQKKRLLLSLTGKEDPTEVKAKQAEWNSKKLAAQYESREETKRQLEKFDRELEFERNMAPEAVKERIEAKTQREKVTLKIEELKLERELNKEKRAAYNREINERERVRVEKEMAEVYGEEGSLIKKLGEDLVLLQAKRRQILIQGDELNKLNFAELANNTRRIQDTTRKWAVEAWNIRNHVKETQNTLKSMQTVYTRMASMTQTMSAAISAASGLFSNMRTAATSFFRYFTNGFRRAFAYVRNLATSTLRAGYEQREKIEQAQIGFAAFFGKENVPAVTQTIRSEAAKTPIVDAGSLASYVQQLAPISKGNASLAINASLGILKSLVYSGSDISEGEYVIKNIRDVIAKGKATAIDIRQFNRALPGLEQALKESGQTGFIDKEGKLNITKANVGQVLDLFAKLNTEANSPLKNIEEEQLRTLSGLKQLFTEKKTTAMETIMEKAGFFDLVKDVFGIANDDDKWTTIANTVGNVLQPVVTKIHDFINSVDWRELGYKISSFFGVIWDGVKEAKNILSLALKDAFGTNTEQVFMRLAEIIRHFIVGFAEGTRDVIAFASDIIKRLSGGNIERFVEMVGKYLVSPLGKLIQMLLGLSQNGIGALSRVFANIASMYKGMGDLWTWASSKGATSFSNRVVSNLTVGQMTAAQLQQALAGKPVTASGKNVVNVAAAGAATGVAALGKEASASASKFIGVKDKLTTFGMAVSRIAIKLMSAVLAGGTIYLLSAGLAELVRSLNRENQAVQGVANALEVLGAVIAGGVAGKLLGGGLTGGLIGAAIGAAAALVKLSAAAREAAEKETKKKVEEIEDKQKQAIYDGIVAAMKAQGINVDTGTDEGWYADQKLKQYINSTDPSSISYNRAANIFAEALRYKNTAEKLVEYTKSDEFQNAGGAYLNLDANTETRNNLAKMIRWFRLNGDSFDYEGSSNEAVIKSYLNGGKITDKQAHLLLDKWKELDVTEAENTTELSKNITATKENTNMTEGAKTAIENATKSVNELQGKIDEIYKDYRKEFIDGSNPIKSFWNTIVGFFTGNINGRALGLNNNAEIDVNGEKKIATIDDVKSAISTRASELARDIKNETDAAKKKQLQEELAEILVALRFASEDQYSRNSSMFIQDYIDKLPWLIDYLKKILANKATGGMITPIHRATGGALGVDTVPAMLQPGEFVMRKASVSKAGLSTMFALNRGDLAAAARSLGSRFGGSYNNSRNWNSVVNNNQKNQNNYIRVFNRNTSARVSSYYGLANRIALA